ncbi:hypothetical protein BDZ89DRAFT_1057064 [Hymenopellis radicata]|nr:hypothetical protein BDZ89DRAFT_1057064 [Hymenopellis radicata]
MESDALPDAREQRRRAVSMLKRAASLPRMEGGRRPRMHTEAVSEGEKAQDGRDPTPDIDTPPPERVEIADEPVVTIEPPPQTEAEEEPTTVRPPSRSRRRSRSRRSKELKARNQAPTPTHGDSSPELGVLPLNPADVPALPPSPGPLSNLARRQQMLRSPTPTGSDALRSLPPSAPPTPGIPSLEEIQRRGILQRSHSAAGRQSAMNKLTGGTDVYDPSMSPSPTGLRRNLTISGDERLTAERTFARKQLLDRLNPRIAKDADAEPNSGEDQPSTTPPPTEVRKKRRRSKSNKRRGSISASNAAVSDSDYITTSPNTPIPPTTPLPQTPIPPDNPQLYFADIRARSATPNYGLVRSFSPQEPSTIHSPEPHRPSPPLHQLSDSDVQIEHDESIHHDNHTDAERPETTRRRSIVVEEEEEEGPSIHYHTTTPPQRTPLNGSPLRLPHSSDALSITSSESHTGIVNVPFYVSDETSSRQDGFPTSPFQTPTKHRLRREEDEEEVLYTRESIGSYEEEREISWVALPVQEYDVELNDPDLAEEHTESPRASSVIIDSEASPDTTPSHSASLTRASNDSISQTFPVRLSVAEHRPESSTKRAGTWQKIKGFARSGSSAGRRSRTNNHTDSSVSRESGVSLHSGRTDRNEGTFMMQQSQHFITQSPAASASVPLLSSPSPLSSYQNPKLFPYGPTPRQLEKNSSTPDINTFVKANHDTQASFSAKSLGDTSGGPPPQDTRIGRQTSDTGMRIKYTGAPPPSIDYFNIPQNLESKEQDNLPTTLLDVRKWMKVKNPKKMFSSTPSSPDPASKKPSLTELLRIRKDTDIVTDREESASGTIVVRPSPPLMTPQHSLSPSPSLRTDTEQTPKSNRVLPHPDTTVIPMSPLTTTPSPPDPLSPTPDPSSTSEYPAHSVSSSSSTTSSNYSADNMAGSKGSIILEKLEENLARSSRSPMWANAIERPPRELLISSAVLQVVNPNTVKDRFLFLFTDILVIAKPVSGQDVTPHGPSPANNKTFIVKSVVMLHELRFTGDRGAETPTRSMSYVVPPRNPILRTFIHQFRKLPDQAISTLFSSLNIADDPALLGQLLFRTTEIDRAQLGDYLSRRTSKLVLKSYLDNFGFVGLRVDRALRAFLLSINVPSKPASTLDYLLDAFASRWYDANATFVAYDKDLAIRLVRAIVQVNDHIHGGLAQEPGPSDPIRMLHMRNFMDAFRRIDVSRLVSDDLLREVFDGIMRERICMAVPAEAARDLLNVTVKRRPPERLTYKVQSEPIHLRLSQPDPHFSIHLYGQGLSSEVSFRVTGVSLGPKTYIMIRSGPNALKYTGLALSSTLTVERAFMRNTFQLAFVNHEGLKRRYMFNVNDPVIKVKWITELQRRCDDATSSRKSMASRFHRPALQETLMGPPPGDKSFERSNGRATGGHVRSKSRSQIYHRQAGRQELDLGNGALSSDQDDEDGDGEDNVEDQKTWSYDELALHCQQNSSIGLLLSYLQVGSPHPELS